MKKNKASSWDGKCQATYDKLKRATTEELVFALPNHDKPFEIHIDASNFAMGGVLMNEGHQIAYEINDIKRRYTVQQKEMTVVIHCL
ncbi:hypothetical protein M5689_018377 [Euphorbia peplus]|nr:hypothetical protein M5689_018377 [Euphorbia peplus]